MTIDRKTFSELSDRLQRKTLRECENYLDPEEINEVFRNCASSCAAASNELVAAVRRVTRPS
jgi:hypothetical protein